MLCKLFFFQGGCLFSWNIENFIIFFSVIVIGLEDKSENAFCYEIDHFEENVRYLKTEEIGCEIPLWYRLCSI